MEPQSTPEELAQMVSPPLEAATPVEPVDAIDETLVISTEDAGETPVAANETREPLSREVTPERRRKEIGLLATNILERQMRAIEKKLADDPRDQTQLLTTNEGVRKINSLRVLQNAGIGVYSTEDAQGNMVQGVDVSNGSPLSLVHEGAQYNVVRILAGKRDSFIVELLSPDKKTRLPAATVPRKDVTTAQLMAEAPAILNALTGSEQQIVALFVQDTKGVATDEDFSTELDLAITETGSAAGIPTAEDMEAFLAAQKSSSPELTTVLTEIRSELASKNILDYQTTMNIITKLGFNVDTLTQGLERSRAEFATQQATLEANPGDEDAKSAVEGLTRQIDLLSRASAVLGEENAILAFFQNVEEGKGDLDMAKEAVAALRSGDIITMITAIAPELAPDPTDSPEQKDDKIKKRKELAETIATMGALGIGGALLLLFKLAIAETKTVQKAMR